ncbi:MAG: FAD-dependent monooxygenase [Chloroflexota bacterium]|nr:FAD-dependent monooxygenase [Chloroflexota bacterium]
MAKQARAAARKGTPFTGQHAIVIGGSIAGLLAGRVLADHFAQVTIIERDALDTAATPRKGVPQGRHGHGLLNRGLDLMADLFPDLFPDLLASGATCLDMGSDLRWYQFGHWKTRYQSSIVTYSQSRPLLEAKIRSRVKALANVRFMDGCAVTALQVDGDGSHITGVQLAQHGSAVPTTLTADLVVEAGGRGSRMPQWLDDLGYGRVKETAVKVDVGYASRIYRRPANAPADWQGMMITPKPPAETRLGLILPIEGDRWMVSLCGWHHDYPPADEAGFLEFARGLPVPDFYNAIRDAEPLEPVATHKLPSNLRRHYERLPRFPEGLAVLGDALCSFNPIYGQGMTTSALDAMMLDACLRQQARRQPAGDITGLANRFRKEVAAVIANPWLMATGEDFRYPQTEGQHPPGLGLLHWYTGQIHALAAHDSRVLVQFLHVMNMLKAPTALFAPPIAWRVLRAQFRRPAAPVAVAVAPPAGSVGAETVTA